MNDFARRRTGWIWVLLVGLAGCAASSHIPASATRLGSYRGGLVGNVFEGPITVELVQAADGQILFAGRFATPDGDYHFRGKVTGEEMQGEISLGFGTITGRLSADRRRMAGGFRLAQNHGTWSALLLP
jgi:hypothetical protein